MTTCTDHPVRPSDRLAAFDVAVRDRRRVTFDSVGPATTLADLARVTGVFNPDDDMSLSGAPTLLIDGRPAALTQRLVGTPIRHGSRIAIGPTADACLVAETLTDPLIDPVIDPVIDRGAGPAIDRGPVIDGVWLAGPDAGATIPIAAGEHFIGRSAGALVRCNDRALELHHALIEVGRDGSVWLTQLAGLQPIQIDGVPVDRRQPLAKGTRVKIGASVLSLRAPQAPVTSPVDSFASPIGHSGKRPDPWRVPLVRSPRPLRTFQADPIEAPRRDRSSRMFGGALLPTLIGLVGAAAMAVLFDQLMFLMFGALGALVAIGTWVAQKVGVIRSRKGAQRDYAQAVATFLAALQSQRELFGAAHLAAVPTIDSSLRMMRARSASLWAVRAADPDSFRVSIGEGDVVWQPNVTGLDRDTAPETWASIDQAARLREMPIPASLAAGTVTALVGGDDAVAIARAMVLQLAAASGPADWRLAVVSERAELWNGLAWLPHIVDAGGGVRIAAPDESADLIARLDDDQRHLVVVVDHPELLGMRTSALRRLLASDRSIAAIVVCCDEATVPAVATSALMIGRRGAARWIADTRVTALAEAVHIAGVSAEESFDAAAAMACLLDPELAGDSAALPGDVSMLELLADQLGDDPARFAQQIAAHWSANGHDPAPATPIGVASDGVIEIDLVSDGPHGLLAGTTGAGKSELLRSLVVGLATRLSPDHISFVLVDYKGGSTFDACAELPHVVGVVTDLDDRLATRALRSLEAELRRREHVLRAAGASDLTTYRAGAAEGRARAEIEARARAETEAESDERFVTEEIAGGGELLPRLVVVIDEFAALAVQQPEFIGALLGVAQRGRSLGVHLLLATQRPSGVVNDDIRANTNLRVALRVQDRSDASDVIGDPAAANLPRSVPGRAIMRLGVDELITFQTACCTGPAAKSEAGARAEINAAAVTELEVLVAAIRQAARINAVAAPHRPWLPALGEERESDKRVVPVDADPTAIGVVDDPDRQRRIPLRWAPSDGHLLLVGATGSGTTTALLSIAAACAAGTNHESNSGVQNLAAPEMFVIDAMGDARLNLLASLPGCAAVVQLHEIERLLRTLSTLDREISHRKARPQVAGERTDIVVIIDGFGALRAELDNLDLFDQLRELDTIIAEGRAVGISVVAATAKPSGIPMAMLSQIANRWVFHLAEPHDASLVGVTAAAVPGPIPGRLIESRSGREAQLDDTPETFLLELACESVGDQRVATRVRRNLSELPVEVDHADLPCGVASGGDAILPIGLSFDSLSSSLLPIASGEHVMVLGPSRSGRTTALHTLVRSWQQLHPDGWIGSTASRRSSARVGAVFADLAGMLEAMPAANDPPRLVVIDDAELVDDPSGTFSAMIAGRHEGLTVLAAGRPDSLRTTYGHWTLAVRRSRLGIAMAACSDLDGDLLSVSLPRRLPIPARPGLAWLVADGDRHLVQIARAGPVGVAISPVRR